MHGRRTGDKWQISRAGVLNFWYYDDEEFAFSEGKLLLRGANGSGKSVTMQSLIPVLLDGKKSPDRLDPFGSRARRMEDYLLGEKDVVDRDERTGYLYLEYKREKKPQYLTTGIGLRARRSAEMEFWGFVILDNRRIGRDIFLYKTEYSVEEGGEQKIPLTRRELENLIGGGGRVVRTQREYMELVNRYVFGFESLEAYEELIELLIQLRSPKLSKDFKPTVIYEILTSSLPALSDEELRPLSDTIENMDQIKQQLDQLARDQEALARLCKQYDLYNQFVLAEKADGLDKAVKRRDKLAEDGRKLAAKIEAHRAEADRCAKEYEKLERERKVLEEEERQLREHDAFKAEQERQGLEAKREEKQRQKSQKEAALAKKRKEEWELRKLIDQREAEAAKAEDEMMDVLESMASDAAEAQFANHSISAAEFERSYRTGYDFTLWKKEAQDHLHRLEAVLSVVRELSYAKKAYEDANRELDEAHKSLDLARDEERKAEDLFEEERQKLLQDTHGWRTGCSELRPTDGEVQEAARRVSQLYEPYRYEEARQPIAEAYARCQGELGTAILERQHEIAAKAREIEAKEAELAEWRAKRDPEPPRHPDTVEARRRLDEMGIPYLPFFAAVEFKDEVPPEVRERIESSIKQMGLLDALIVPSNFKDTCLDSDKIIRPRPQILAPTLADFLYPTPVSGVAISAGDIANVLASIVVTDSESAPAAIRRSGLYQIGIIVGSAPREEQAIYIGREARRRFRQQTIARLEEELALLESELAGLKAGLDALYERQRRLEAEYVAFPRDAGCRAAYEKMTGARLEVQARAKEVERRNGKVREALAKLQEARSRLRSVTEGLSLEPTEEAYEWAKASMRQYVSGLQELELKHKDFANGLALASQYHDRLSGVEADADELRGELGAIDGELAELAMRLEQVKKRLAELGAEEIQRRIAGVVERLRAIPREAQDFLVKRERALKDAEAAERDIQRNSSELTLAQFIFETWKKVFLDDDRLGLVEYDAPKSGESEGESEEGILTRARAVLKRFGSLVAPSSNLDRERVTGRLNKAYYEEAGTLVEYRLTQEGVLDADLSGLDAPEIQEARAAVEAAPGTSFDGILEQLSQKSRRIQIIMEYGGKRVSPYFVLARLDADIELQKKLLSEKDRELYEEIIMHSVGRIIRERITRAEQWVARIRSLMDERDTSSGLKFDLRWRPRTAESEDEMDTRDLVDLLRANPNLLKDEDMMRVVRHFRSKINRAKEILADRGHGETLHQVIKEVLDYRQWFTFTLYYQREGEQKKELTNNVFYKFSGGEKAMAMYIPLFSAAYSRYSEAREDAPHIITLDEAFAGVDEHNIRDMFDLLEKLGFNYIMNSQALWGDYDTVPALSICELVRRKNEPCVAVVRYRWNGKVRQLVTRGEEPEDEWQGGSEPAAGI